MESEVNPENRSDLGRFWPWIRVTLEADAEMESSVSVVKRALGELPPFVFEKSPVLPVILIRKSELNSNTGIDCCEENRGIVPNGRRASVVDGRRASELRLRDFGTVTSSLHARFHRLGYSMNGQQHMLTF